MLLNSLNFRAIGGTIRRLTMSKEVDEIAIKYNLSYRDADILFDRLPRPGNKFLFYL